jgi:hypothetical protein
MLPRFAFRAKAPLCCALEAHPFTANAPFCALKAPRCTNCNTSYRMLPR